MNTPEDRPPANDRPAPFDPPDQRPAPPAATGGPPADTAGEPVESFSPPPAAPAPPSSGEPEATWEDVVDPQPETPAAEPASAAPARARVESRAATATATRDDEDYDDEFDDDYVDEPASRWVSLLATIGTALIAIVTVQVLASLIEGFTLRSGQRVGVPDDLFHRMGYPFGGLGATALVFLVLGVVLVSMPSVLDELLSESQDRVVSVALVVAIVMGVIIAVGSLLAVRANLHEYAAKNVPVPSYVRVQFTNFLLGSLGAAALALFGAIASMNERNRERFD